MRSEERNLFEYNARTIASSVALPMHLDEAGRRRARKVEKIQRLPPVGYRVERETSGGLGLYL